MTVEPETAPEPDSTLYVSESGSVVRSFRGETPFTLIQKHAVNKRPVDLASLLGVEKPGPVGRGQRSPLHPSATHGLRPWSSPRPRRCGCLPGCTCQRRAIKSGRWSSCSNRPAAARRRRRLSGRLAEQGCQACAPDLRGLGDATPEFGRGAARHGREHNNEEHYSWSG